MLTRVRLPRPGASTALRCLERRGDNRSANPFLSIARSDIRKHYGELTFPHDVLQGLQQYIQEADYPLNDRRSALHDHQMHRIQRRFVSLIDQTGTPVCPPVFVEFSEFSYLVSDAEFELRAIKIAVEDGLLSADRRASVRAHFDTTARV